MAETGIAQRSSALLDLGRHAEAEALVRQGLAQEPGDTALLGLLVRSLIGQSKAKEALASAEGLVAQSPDSAYAQRLLAISCRLRRKPEASEAAAREAVRLGPEDGWNHYVLAQALRARSAMGEARRAVRQAVRLDPEKPDFLVLYGYLHLVDGYDKEKARKAFRRALRLEPENADAVRGLALARWDQIGFGGTVQELRRSLSLDPADPEPAYAVLLAQLWQLLKQQERLAIVSFLMFLQGCAGDGPHALQRLLVGVLLGAGAVLVARDVRGISADGWRFIRVVCRRKPLFAVVAASTAACFATGEFWALAGTHTAVLAAFAGYGQRGLVSVAALLAKLFARWRSRGR